MRIRFVVPLLVIAVSWSFSQRLSRDEREILWHQDQRSVSDSVLYRYLADKSSSLRGRAALALANIQDTSSIPFLIPLLDDRSASVRAKAAFALGQIGSPSSGFELSEHLRSETNPSVLTQLLEALGKSGGRNVYDDVVAFGLPKKLSALKAVQAVSLARFALRGIKSERGVWFCFDLLDEKYDRTKWTALYALWRMAPHGAIDVEISKRREALKKMCSNRNPNVRMNLATLMGRSRSNDAFEVLQALQQYEQRRGKGNWRVQVNMIKALAAFAGRHEEALKSIAEFLGSRNDDLAITALTSIGALRRDIVKKSESNAAIRKQLIQLAKSAKRSQMVRGEAMVALARHAPEEFRFESMIGDPKVPQRLQSKVIEAMCEIPSGEHLAIVLDQLESDSVRVAMAAWDFVRKLLSPKNLRMIRKDTAVTSDLGAKLYRKAKLSLLREDLAITTLVGNAFADSSVFALLQQDGYDDRGVEELMLAYGNLSSPNDGEAMQALLHALGSIGDPKAVPLLDGALTDPDRNVGLAAAAAIKEITGNDVSDQVPVSSKPLFTDYDWRTLERIPAKQSVAIKTGRGTIRIRLMKDEAPFTVLSFYRLIRKKFFNGLTFHRVVPNFVIQGGDPRGDGWGGPNYSIRTEVGLSTYERGSVGVASAGKDTEGCQFFITQSPQPHLDGRYTIFGKVTSGFSVLDKIQVGDTIISMTLTR